MQALTRRARYAARVIFIAFAMHKLNGAYIEPRYLGFGSYADYAGLLMAVAYIPVYLFTVLVWALWLALVWRRA